MSRLWSLTSRCFGGYRLITYSWGSTKPFVTPERIELPPRGPKPRVLTDIRRGNNILYLTTDYHNYGETPVSYGRCCSFDSWITPLGRVAEETGFEPATRVNGRRFSRPLDNQLSTPPIFFLPIFQITFLYF